mmetsp:Transcript_26973/g.41103  ORF Transcript_26973/g.41103 Transcript_26973/m.41103 type:complete len:143 (-) Transcript_26973:10-438(-)
MARRLADTYPSKEQQPFWIAQYFVLMNFCYQLGNFLGRAALRWFKTEGLTRLTLLQILNFAILFTNTQSMAFKSLWVMCPAFLWVGLLAGAGFSNCIHQILTTDVLKETERESAISFACVTKDSGVFVATILSVILSHTAFA